MTIHDNYDEAEKAESQHKLMAKLVDPITISFRGEAEVYWAGKLRELCPSRKLNNTLKDVVIAWAKAELSKREQEQHASKPVSPQT